MHVCVLTGLYCPVVGIKHTIVWNRQPEWSGTELCVWVCVSVCLPKKHAEHTPLYYSTNSTTHTVSYFSRPDTQLPNTKPQSKGKQQSGTDWTFAMLIVGESVTQNPTGGPELRSAWLTTWLKLQMARKAMGQSSHISHSNDQINACFMMRWAKDSPKSHTLFMDYFLQAVRLNQHTSQTDSWWSLQTSFRLPYIKWT